MFYVEGALINKRKSTDGTSYLFNNISVLKNYALLSSSKNRLIYFIYVQYNQGFVFRLRHFQ